jgi:hypothetical protein
MELFKNIRLKTGEAFLLKKLTKIKRKVYYLNFSKVKNIGLIWDASTPDHFASISRFYQKMHDRSVEVSVLGYFAGKNLPDQYTAVRYLTLLRRNDLNLFFHPQSTEAEKFINTKFDVLIDVNFKKVLPLRYITALSRAQFKAGLFGIGEGESPFDLMMEIKEPVNIDNYLNQIVEYLELINSEIQNGK